MESNQNKQLCVCELLEQQYNSQKALRLSGTNIPVLRVSSDIDERGETYVSLNMVLSENCGWMITASGESLAETSLNYCPFCGRELKML
jgi:hypothetical protein